ncbi:20168_t:CDS:2 [Racocetra fulgida]|uniref:20168_t:CDS:1 n=1 Tax=Racocetra fulgida TaxID=60492 RepID=A0A9N8Z5P3_9GLOM|nr:20168_t:CDS:2 [Racocetra fulgida]
MEELYNNIELLNFQNVMDLEEYIDYSEEKIEPQQVESDEENDSVDMPQITYKEALDAVYRMELYLMQQDLNYVVQTEHDIALSKLYKLIKMSNTHITPGELIKTGTIVPELHYGSYLRDWWVFSEENPSYPIPIRLGLEVMIQLHKNPFIIRVVRSIHSPLQPGYICEGSGQSSGIVTSASTAITSVYQSIFGTKTRFSGLAYLGLDQNKTAQKLLENVTFCPFIIKLESISIFVGSLGKITHSNKVGNHYTTSLFYKYKTKQSVFLQCINDNSYSITVYQDSQVVNEYRDTSPNAVWQQTGVLKSICGETLFAINHPTTLYNLEQIYKTKFHYQISIPNNCTVADWDNKIIMNHLFELHLKKAVSKSNEGWHRVFQSWKQQKSNIIELHTHIRKTYGQDYEFRNRELWAWRAVFRAAGCTEITPCNKENSEVITNKLIL